MNKEDFNTSNKPYKFLDYYDTDDKNIFFGRDRETEILLSDIISTRLVVLFAKTGTGKTSLINAGIRPRLEELDYATFYIRVEKDPIESVTKKLNDENLLTNKNKKEPLAAQLLYVVEKLEKPIVVFFDQFEEFFIYIVNKNPKKAHQFIINIAKIYSDSKSGIHIVFSLREEFFVELDIFRDEIPSIFHHDSNLRLQWFNEEQARNVIIKPAKKFGINIEESLVNRLIKDLSVNNKIEPARLQVVCDTLWKNRKYGEILLSDYEKLGDAERIFDQRIEEDIDRNLNDEQLVLFEKLLPVLRTEHGTKYVRGFDELVKTLKTDTYSLQNLIKSLKTLRLIRDTILYGELYLEWTSDYLIVHKNIMEDRIRTISLRRKIRAAMSKIDLKMLDFSTKKKHEERSLFEDFLEDDEESLLKLIDFNEISEGADLLSNLSSNEAKFMFVAALQHGNYMNKWFQKGTQARVDCWKILEDRLQSEKTKCDQVKNSIHLLGELKEERALKLLKTTLNVTSLGLITLDVLRKMKTDYAIIILDMALERKSLMPRILEVLHQMRQEGIYAKNNEINLNTIAMLLSEDTSYKDSDNYDKIALEKIFTKYAKNLFLSSLEHGLDLVYWFDNAFKHGIDVWQILKELIISTDYSREKTENTLKLLCLIGTKKAMDLLDFSLNQSNLFGSAFKILNQMETLEVVELWESKLKHGILISQAMSSLEHIIVSETAKQNVKDRAKSVLNNWKKNQEKSKAKFHKEFIIKREVTTNLPVGLNEDKWEYLIKMVKDGNCTPFLGAGATSHILPLGAEVSRILAQKYKYPLSDDEDNLQRVSSYIAIKKEETISLKYEIIDILRNIGNPDFSDENELHKILSKLPFPIYMTTNYDDFMLRALKEMHREPKYEFSRWNNIISKAIPPIIEKDFNPSYEKPLVYYFHGSWNVPESLVITEDDYIDFLITITKNIEEKLPHTIIRSLSMDSLIFIGYNLQDIAFRSIFKSILDIVATGLKRTNISVQLTPADEYKISIKRCIQSLERFIYSISLKKDIEIEINTSISSLKEIINRYPLTKNDKDLLIQQTIKLEQMILKLSLKNSLEESFIKIINSLQNIIGNISTEGDQKIISFIKYLEDYYKELKIDIYWGTPQQFVKELMERWKKF